MILDRHIHWPLVRRREDVCLQRPHSPSVRAEAAATTGSRFVATVPGRHAGAAPAPAARACLGPLRSPAGGGGAGRRRRGRHPHHRPDGPGLDAGRAGAGVLHHGAVQPAGPACARAAPRAVFRGGCGATGIACREPEGFCALGRRPGPRDGRRAQHLARPARPLQASGLAGFPASAAGPGSLAGTAAGEPLPVQPVPGVHGLAARG